MEHTLATVLTIGPRVPAAPSENKNIPHLPGEVIDQIFTYLEAEDLASASLACRDFHHRVAADSVWQNVVQKNTPGAVVTRPYPFKTFRELFLAHARLWFIPRAKVWYSGTRLTGKIIVARFNPSVGCIEAFQLIGKTYSVGGRPRPNTRSPIILPDLPLQRAPGANPLARISNIKVSLHLDRTVFQRDAAGPVVRPTDPGAFLHSADGSTVTMQEGGPFATQFPIKSRQPLPVNLWPLLPAGQRDQLTHYISLARPLAPLKEAKLEEQSFWPPTAIPAKHRVYCPSGDDDQEVVRQILENPDQKGRSSDIAFYLRSRFEVVSHIHQSGPLGERNLARTHSNQIDTYATLEFLYCKPTSAKPYQGLFVGDFGVHGCQFVLVHQPDSQQRAMEESRRLFRSSIRNDNPNKNKNSNDDRNNINRIKIRNILHNRPNRANRNRPPPSYNEDDEEIATLEMPPMHQLPPTRLMESIDSHGHYPNVDVCDPSWAAELRAIKLTGDPTMPRGRCTFYAKFLSDNVNVGVGDTANLDLTGTGLEGVHCVRSQGQMSRSDFDEGRFTDSLLFLVSPDLLVNYWTSLKKVIYFQRVDIDAVLEEN